MKTRKILSFLVAMMMIVLTMNCSDDDAVTYSVRDVSPRIAGFSSDFTGAGAPFTVTGTQMDQVVRVFIGDLVVPARAFTDVTASSITFTVPSAVETGKADLLFVWPGPDRGYNSIDIVPLQVFHYADKDAGGAGETVTVFGANLDIVESVKLGDVDATLTSVTPGQIEFTVPDGASTGKITLVSEAFATSSPSDFVACETSVAHPKCLTPLNVNGNFENGTAGVVGGEGNAGGNWYLAGSGTRATYEIIEAPGGAPNLGTKTLKVTITTLSANNWDIQIVNDGFPVPAGKKFQYMGRIWADNAGRVARIAGGVSVPGYQDMEGGITLTLNQGWNEFSIPIQHTTPPQDDKQVRLQTNLSYPENEDAVFYFDDFRVVETGDR